NDSFDTAITAVEEVYTARANMPGARDVDEDYQNGPQSMINKWRGVSVPMPSWDAASGIIDAGLNKGAIDDRKMLLETALTTMSSLPKSGLADALNQKTIALLYRDLPHPPASFIGNKYAWRQPDGSHNNPHNPDLGKAGTFYARSVQGQTPMPLAEQPDPGLIFDTLLRREKFKPHPSGNSAMMFGFATLVIHSCFRTNHDDWTINDTSSYVDLSPLYGNKEEDLNKLRRFDGTGLMWNDVFAEDRLLFLPPISCALLVLFCRNHNYIATKLLEINEKKKWTNPPPKDPKALRDQDDEIFNIARLINCAWFAGIVFSDYLAAILGLSRDANPWSMDPFSEIRNDDHTMVERGQGNANSVEFNLLYRWHATLSEPDVSWLERMFSASFGKPPEE
ncbi:12445_t:CDS:2, partial [Acaulospora colombiana]